MKLRPKVSVDPHAIRRAAKWLGADPDLLVRDVTTGQSVEARTAFIITREAGVERVADLFESTTPSRPIGLDRMHRSE
jgi:hypothetical protein